MCVIASFLLLLSFLLCLVSDYLLIPASIFLGLSLSVISCSVGLTTKHVACGDQINKIMTVLTLGRGAGVMISTLCNSFIQSISLVYVLAVIASSLSTISIIYVAKKHPKEYQEDIEMINATFSNPLIVRSTGEYSVPNDSTKGSV